MKNSFKIICILILLLWTIISCIRTIYNVQKLPGDIKQFITSEDGLRSESFGRELRYVSVVRPTLLSNQVVLRADDKDSFFMLRYLFYPTKLYPEYENRSPKDVQIIEYP